jgi:hypothetical protein
LPRLNVERTNELRAWSAHEEYLEDNFKGYAINEGWVVDYVFRIIQSKVYTRGIVTTSMNPPFPTDFEEF